MSQSPKKDGGPSRWPYPELPAGRPTLEKLCALRPDLAEEVWRRFNTSYFPRPEAERLIAEATEARKPKMHNSVEVAERAHHQSAEQLRVRHAEEAAEQLCHIKERQQEAARQRYQAILDHWIESQREAAAFERRLRRDLDPVGYGHWNPERERGYRD